MKKRLTEEEFLDKKNTDVHKEILNVFKQRELNRSMIDYINRARSERPNLFCDIERSKKRDVSLFYYHHQLLVDLVEMIKDGTLIFKDKK